ncbi:MAG: hypothetical protein LCH38_03295 [Proteobacteria bacterium]|nr:hypothetical protein [Pseudomonadota bacterium]
MLTIGFAKPRRGAPVAFVPSSGNVISNWSGAGAGGTSGLPNDWFAVSVAGVVFSVLSRTPYRGGTAIEFQFAGTTSAGGAVYVRPASLLAPAAPGQVWRHRVFSEAVGTPSPSQMEWRIHWSDASQAFLSAGAIAVMGGSLSGSEIAPADSVAPASTAYCRAFFYLSVTAGQSINLRYRVFAPTLFRIS